MVVIFSSGPCEFPCINPLLIATDDTATVSGVRHTQKSSTFLFYAGGTYSGSLFYSRIALKYVHCYKNVNRRKTSATAAKTTKTTMHVWEAAPLSACNRNVFQKYVYDVLRA